MAAEPHIRVIEHGSIRTLRIGRVEQSSMYLDSPFDTDFDYPVYLHLTVAVVPNATRTLMIGLGGGTVVKCLWRDHPEMIIDAVEIEPKVVALARTHFELPDDERIRVHVAEGRAYLEASPDTYDIVIVDAFVDDTVPLPLQTEEFGRLVIAHLTEEGVLAYNFHGSVAGERSKPFRRLHKTLRSNFAHVWAFPVGLAAGGEAGAHREVILLATNADLSTAELRERIESRADGRVTVPHFEQLAEDLYREPIRSGDVAALCDPHGYTHDGGGAR